VVLFTEVLVGPKVTSTEAPATPTPEESLTDTAIVEVSSWAKIGEEN